MFSDHMSRVDEGDPMYLECHISHFKKNTCKHL